MKILSGRRAENLEEAAGLAFQAAGAAGMPVGLIDLFSSFLDKTESPRGAEKNIASAIRERYRGNPSWTGKRWLVPIPRLSCDVRGLPQLTIEIKIYLVAALEVETSERDYSVTLVGAMDRSSTVAIPIVFLRAVLENDLGRFRVVARSSARTTWEIPGGKDLELPADFPGKLSEVLESNSIASWLADFGPQGRIVAPLVVGSLLGLRFQGSTPAVLSGKQPWTMAQLIAALEALAFSSREAKQMADRAVPYLGADITLEEAVRLAVQQVGKEDIHER